MNRVLPVVFFRNSSTCRSFLLVFSKSMSLQVNNNSFHSLASDVRRILNPTNANNEMLITLDKYHLLQCLHLQTSSNVSSTQANSVKDFKVEPSCSNINSTNSSNQPEQSDGTDYKFYEAKVALLSLLPRSEKRIARLINKYPEFASLTVEQVNERIAYLERKNVPLSRIQRYPWFILHNPGTIEKKVNLICCILKLDFTSGIAFIRIPEQQLHYLKILWYEDQQECRILKEEGKKYGKKFSNRLEYLSRRLKCTVEEVADLMIGNEDLTSVLLFSFRDKIDLLEGCNIPVRKIVSKRLIFKSSISRLSQQIQLFQERQDAVMKPITIRLPHPESQPRIRKRNRKISIRYPGIAEHLKNRLGCNDDEVQTILSKISVLAAWKEIGRLDDKIAYLLEQGFSKTAILQRPGVLKISKATLASRIWEFRRRGLEVTSLKLIYVKDWSIIHRRIILHDRALHKYKTTTTTTINAFEDFAVPTWVQRRRGTKPSKGSR